MFIGDPADPKLIGFMDELETLPEKNVETLLLNSEENTLDDRM